VKIHSYDSIPLVKKMGLKVSCTELDPENLTDVQVIDSVLPFSFSGEMRADIAVNLDWRHGNGPWQQTGTEKALIKIEFSAEKDARLAPAYEEVKAAPPASSVKVVVPASRSVPEDVNRAIDNICLMERALDQWNLAHPPPKKRSGQLPGPPQIARAKA
jgi:hypothetical protein